MESPNSATPRLRMCLANSCSETPGFAGLADDRFRRCSRCSPGGGRRFRFGGSSRGWLTFGYQPIPDDFDNFPGTRGLDLANCRSVITTGKTFFQIHKDAIDFVIVSVHPHASIAGRLALVGEGCQIWFRAIFLAETITLLENLLAKFLSQLVFRKITLHCSGLLRACRGDSLDLRIFTPSTAPLLSVASMVSDFEPKERFWFACLLSEMIGNVV